MFLGRLNVVIRVSAKFSLRNPTKGAKPLDIFHNIPLRIRFQFFSHLRYFFIVPRIQVI